MSVDESGKQLRHGSGLLHNQRMAAVRHDVDSGIASDRECRLACNRLVSAVTLPGDYGDRDLDFAEPFPQGRLHSLPKLSQLVGDEIRILDAVSAADRRVEVRENGLRQPPIDESRGAVGEDPARQLIVGLAPLLPSPRISDAGSGGNENQRLHDAWRVEGELERQAASHRIAGVNGGSSLATDRGGGGREVHARRDRHRHGLHLVRQVGDDGAPRQGRQRESRYEHEPHPGMLS